MLRALHDHAKFRAAGDLFHGVATESDEDRVRAPHPVVFLVLNLPFGMTSGYIFAVLPLQLTTAGVSVAATASIVAFANSPKVWKFIWAPVADLTLTFRAWYAIGASMAAGMLATASLLPPANHTLWAIAASLFLAEVGTSFLTIALAGLMATSVPSEQKGRASGWYQLGGKLGRGTAAGVGIWLAIHAQASFMPGTLLGLACALCILALFFVQPATARPTSAFRERMDQYGRDLLDLWRVPSCRYVLLIAVLPIGIAGVSNFWSGVGADWRASPNVVALMTGPTEIVAAIGGCLFAGRLADRFDRRVVFLGCGAALVVAEIILSLAPRTPVSFIGGTFSISILLAMSDAAMTALALSVIGVRGAATKYAIIFGFANLPDLYMTPLSGFVHDAWGLRAMLQVEAVVALTCIAAAWAYAAAQSRHNLDQQVPASE